MPNNKDNDILKKTIDRQLKGTCVQSISCSNPNIISKCALNNNLYIPCMALLIILVQFS